MFPINKTLNSIWNYNIENSMTLAFPSPDITLVYMHREISNHHNSIFIVISCLKGSVTEQKKYVLTLPFHEAKQFRVNAVAFCWAAKSSMAPRKSWFSSCYFGNRARRMQPIIHNCLPPEFSLLTGGSLGMSNSRGQRSVILRSVLFGKIQPNPIVAERKQEKILLTT